MGPERGEALNRAAPPPLTRPPADPWRRAVARIIDLAIVATLLWTLVLFQVFWFMDRLSQRVDPEPWGRWFAPTVAFVVIFAVFEVLFLVRNRGQTPGKDVMKIRVVPRRAGGKISVVRAVRRWVLLGVAALVHPIWMAALVLGIVGLPAAMTGRRSMCDRLAGTVVVHYDRDREDPTARRPINRRERRERRRREREGEAPPVDDKEKRP